MSRILFINSVCYGSTGSICKNLYKLAKSKGHTCCIAFGRGESPIGYQTIKIGTKLDFYTHALSTRIFDDHGLRSKNATLKFLKEVDKFKPDIIHLHNIHGYYLNYEVLFEYLKKHTNIKVIWTIHDCWPFTGHCSHYLFENCYKWKIQCEKCPLKNEYPTSNLLDNSKSNYLLKKSSFNGLRNLILVPVSKWLDEQIEESFLNDYESIVIESGIDIEVFNYRETNFKHNHNIENRKMILGVANIWTNRKGLNDFIELSKLLGEEYVIVLVGLSERQISQLPNNIIGIKRTSNAYELSDIYSSADVYINLSKEETYGLTNVEAQACGTPVISYISGGTPETMKNSNTYLVENNIENVIEVLSSNNFKKELVINKELFDKNNAFNQYIKLYERN